MSAKNCLNNDISGSEMFHNIRKEWIEQLLSGRQNTQFLYALTKQIDYFY